MEFGKISPVPLDGAGEMLYNKYLKFGDGGSRTGGA